MKNLYEIIPMIYYFLEKIIGSKEFILLVSIISILIKSFIFFILISRVLKSNKIIKPLILLFLVIIGSIISDFTWIVTILQKLFLINIEYKYLRFLTRFSWSFYVIYYQALALFIETLSNKINSIELRQKIFVTISSFFAIFFIGLGLYQFNCYDPSMRPQIEISMLTFSPIYMTLILMPISLFYTIKKIRKKNIPRILQRQLKVFTQFIVTPILFADLIQTYPFTFIASNLTNTYAAVGISSILITYGIFHCMRKIMDIRFLNFERHVQAQNKMQKLYFVDDFKTVLDKFSQTTTTSELENITQDFFKDAFSIPKNRTRLHIKLLNTSKENTENVYSRNSYELLIDNFINNYNSETNVGIFLRKNKIIITDELEFSNFYDETDEYHRFLQLMNKISADIFIPIFENESFNKNIDPEDIDLKKLSSMNISGYIIVDRYARINNKNKNAPFYSDIERDQMLVYSNYLGNLIKLLQTRSLNQIINNEKKLKEDLSSKQEELNQYRESLEYFLRNNENNKNNANKKIGIIFYKNKKFEFENQAAQEFIPVELNIHNGHPITKKLKKIATKAIEYKSQQTCFINDRTGENIIATAIPNSEKNNAIIITYYPGASDILNKKTGLLKDRTKNNFLLYLETTKSGKLVNNFIPLENENVLNFKIDFLITALNKKNILIDSCPQDAIQIAEIITKTNSCKSIYTISLKKPCKNLDVPIKLFGINHILETNPENTKPLLEILDKTGILFIKNVHFLDIETQEYLYEFIRYGFFKEFRSMKKTFSDVKIIFSSNINLQEAVNKNEFSKELFSELKKACIKVPSIKTFNNNELENLITGYTEQAIKTEELQYILELTELEKRKIINSSPESFYELKNNIQKILIKKSKPKNTIQETIIQKNHAQIPNKNFETKTELKLATNFSTTYDLKDKELIEAIKLGKNALKDIKIMSMLWTKFKNQNKIASLLGVNRSSINRRCKEYNLFE
ncbi:MAG: Two-component system, NtrC family, transcriptional regulator [candidate division TM6 bacterium GW2011_GWF2_30_66]|nr:MAG: Two-component system, NtrC family, transcriptional regulator [candidate division TM6 bacterium GW2011_GWF2_30_66]